MNKVVSPWSVPVTVDQVPESGLHLELEAPDAVRAEIARLAGARDVSRLTAVFDLSRRGAGLQIDGRVAAKVGQTCVVSLEPMESEVDEAVDLRFAPEAPEAAVAAEIDAGSDEEPETLIDGKVDLGAIATEFLILGLDPYPRKPGVEFAAPAGEEKGEHPFAALAALQKKPGGGKP